jgi:hypothetical protein
MQRDRRAFPHRRDHPSRAMPSVFAILLLSVVLLGVLFGRQRVRGVQVGTA